MFKKLTVLFLGAAAMFGSSANAAITALQIAPIQTDLETTIANVTPAVIAIMAIVLGVVIGVKLVKRLIGSGT